MICSYVLATTGVDQLWLVPCWEHAFAKALAPFDSRVEMCRRALESLAPSRIAVSLVESELGGTSRTIDTVRHLLEQHPGWRFDLVVGSDIFGERASWKAFDELERLCEFIVIGRAGFPVPEDHVTSPVLCEISSTRVRQGIADGAPIDRLVPAGVADYIKTSGLYR